MEIFKDTHKNDHEVIINPNLSLAIRPETKKDMSYQLLRGNRDYVVT